MQLEWIYQAEEAITIKAFLQAERLPRAFLKSVKFEGGDILLNQQRVNVRALMQKGDCLQIIAAPEVGHDSVQASTLPIEIVYEDADYLILNKPAATLSIPSRRDPDLSMANRIKGYYERMNYQDQVIHIVTRLDRDTTGLMLVAKHRLAHAYMDRIIKAKQLIKIYAALSHRQDWPDHGFIDVGIARNPDSIISRMASETGQAALTEYFVLERYDDSSLLKLNLHTGKTHQIRVHLSHEGGPLVGDDLYGGIKSATIQRQALHCQEISFPQPFSKEMIQIEIPLPSDMQAWINERRRP